MDRNMVRNIVCIVLVALYFAGLVCMFCGQLTVGIALWAVSTVGGFAALYHIRNAQEKEDARRKAEDGGKDDGKDGETPCE